MVNKKIKKITYLYRSFAQSIASEGLWLAMHRAYSYIVYGKGFLQQYATEKKDVAADLKMLLEKKKNVSLDEIGCVDVVIPVYNGYQYLHSLFLSLEKTSYDKVRWIIVNDASTDDRVAPFLESLEEKYRLKGEVIKIQNETNLGFVKTVNKAVTHVKHHFILLNTDTEVPQDWVKRMISPILIDNNIASVTPMSNAATIASFPYINQDNETFDGLNVDVIDDAFRKIGEGNVLDTPTGIGFCMAFNLKVVRAIGMFDEEAFGKGYGEENDWCLRAEKAGFRNVITPGLYVYHKHGGSFPSSEKKALIQDHLKIIDNRYPDYFKNVERFLREDPLYGYRGYAAALVSAKSPACNGRVLFVDHNLGGGAGCYSQEKMTELINDGFLVVAVRYDISKERYNIELNYNKLVYEFFTNNKELLSIFLESIKFTVIYINELVSYPDPLEFYSDLIELKKDNKDLKIIFLLHDYFCICPNYVLIGKDKVYCGLDYKNCSQCIKLSAEEFKKYYTRIDTEKWRTAFKELLSKTDEIVAFSESSKNILNNAYPSSNFNVVVKPHSVNYLRYKANIRNVDKILTLGVLGSITDAKGARIISDLVDLLEKEKTRMRIVVIGQIIGRRIVSEKLHQHGAYRRDQIEELLKHYKIDALLIPSVWPETFSYTAQEAALTGLPVFVFDIGAPAERLRGMRNGYVISNMSAEALLRALKDYNNNNENVQS